MFLSYMVVVLIPYTSQLYGRMTHPVGKSYAINIEAEKLYFYCRQKPRFGRNAEWLDFLGESEYNWGKETVIC